MTRMAGEVTTTKQHNGRVTLYGGDNRDALRGMADNSVDSIVTDPPYALVSIVKRFGGANAAPAQGDVYARATAGFMGKAWDTGEVAFATEFWAECLRVLKPGGHVVAFSGTRTYHRLAVAIEDSGFEIRDQLAWVYGTGFPKSHDVAKDIDKRAGHWRGKAGDVKTDNGAMSGGNYERTDKGEPITPAAQAWQGWGTALKPAWEPIIFARKPLIGTVAANVIAHGTGAINIDGCRVAGVEDTARPQGKDIKGGKWSGDGGRSDLVTGGGTGRFPANIIHDGSDEVVGMFPDSKGQQGDVKGTEPSSVTAGVYGEFAGRVASAKRNDSGSAARFFYSAKASKRDRNEGLEHMQASANADVGALRDGDRPTMPRANTHPTVKPTALMQWLCRLVTPPGGVVLDPFMGSGSTGKAAVLEGFQFVGMEREAEYIPIAEARIAWAVAQQQPVQAENDNVQAGLFAAGATA